MAAHIKDYRAIKLLGRDETTIADITGTLMPSTGGTVSILATTSTIPVSFATSSTVQAVSAPSTGSTVESHLISTTSTIPVSWASASTVAAQQSGVWSLSTTSTVPVSWTTTTGTQPVSISTTSTYPVSFAATSTVQAVTALAYTSTQIWSSYNATAGGTSASVDLRSYTTIGAFVNTSTAMDIRILVSPDNAFWVNDTSISFDAAGSMGWDCIRSAGYYKLWTSAAGTVTAWIVGKSA